MDQISSALNIMRRMPPSNIEDNLSGLLNLVPEHTDELLQRVDQPLEAAVCPTSGRKYLLCDYNRDGDSYRSPWTNEYNPPIEDGDGFVPSDQLRELEIQTNEVFDAYRELYFEGGVSSVYLWDLAEGFAGCFLIKKDVEGLTFVKSGSWDSIHVIEVLPSGDGSEATYKLTTTIMLSMKVANQSIGDANLSGSLTRQAESKMPLNDGLGKTHITNMGTIIENLEIDMRSNLDQLYIQKTREVINGIRHVRVGGPQQGQGFVMDLNSAVLKHGKNRKVDSE
jgi:capping protein beta